MIDDETTQLDRLVIARAVRAGLARYFGEKMDTMMTHAFERAGIKPRDAALKLALAKFRNNGGNYEEAKALLDTAYEMPGKARRSVPKRPNDTCQTPGILMQTAGPRESRRKAS